MNQNQLQRKLAAILYADVAGYSRLTGVDEEGTHRMLRDSLDLISASVESHHGRVVHYAGDAVLADFGTVLEALTCATEIQRVLKQSNRAYPEERRVRFRIGINLGDVIVDQDEIYGDGVNVAARLESLAEPGGICVSESVRAAAGSKLKLAFDFSGEQRVKNIAEAVRTYRVLFDRDSDPVADISEAMTEGPSIAVLAFENMSNDPEQEYFSDGIAEDIITELSRVPGLFVIARNSAFTYKGRQVNIREIGRDLGVRHVLEGSVRKAGNRVRITAQLIDTVSGGHAWAERYDRELADIFAVQDEVTSEIVRALAPKLAGTDQRHSQRRPTDNLEAYDYFLRGRQLALQDSSEANVQARRMLEKAIELDPGFALAVAHLGRNHVVAYVNRWDQSTERSLRRGLELCEKALDLDDSSPFAHFAMCAASVWAKQLDTAQEEANKSLALDPNFADSHAVLGLINVYSGRPDEALDCLHRGMRLDPHYRDIFLHILGQAYFHKGRYQDAVVALKRRLIRKPDSDISRVLLASAYGHLGELDKARAEWREALRINPDYSIEHRRQILPFKNPDDFNALTDGLEKAGLPD